MKDIRVLIENGKWVPARDYQKIAFKEFMKLGGNTPYHYEDDDIIFTVERVRDGKNTSNNVFIVREDGSKIQIADLNAIDNSGSEGRSESGDDPDDVDFIVNSDDDENENFVSSGSEFDGDSEDDDYDEPLSKKS